MILLVQMRGMFHQRKHAVSLTVAGLASWVRDRKSRGIL